MIFPWGGRFLDTFRLHPARIWLIVLFVGGIILWGNFYSWGDFPIDFHDWAEVNAPRLAVAQDAVLKGVLPLHSNKTWLLRGITDRYLSIPDTLISPQIILLRSLDIPFFFFINHLIYYTIGLAGLIWLNRRIHLSVLSFSLLFVLFNFNGHIVSHTSIGHTSWGGYYLYPWFAGVVIDFIDGKPGWRWASRLGAILGFSLLQGSFHQFTWMVLFLILVWIPQWRKIVPLIKGGIAVVFFAAFRILPPILLLGQFDDEFKGGYSTPLWILKSLVVDIDPSRAMDHIFPTTSLGWWEFDTYIGSGGFILIGVGLLAWAVRTYREEKFLILTIAISGMTLLSISKVYELFRLIPIPLLSGERVASRMISVALFFVVMIAAIEFQRVFHDRKTGRVWIAAYVFLLGVSTYQVIRHMLAWTISRAFPNFPNTPVDLSLLYVANRSDPPYEGLIITGIALTISGGLLLTWLVRREKV